MPLNFKNRLSQSPNCIQNEAADTRVFQIKHKKDQTPKKLSKIVKTQLSQHSQYSSGKDKHKRKLSSSPKRTQMQQLSSHSQSSFPTQPLRHSQSRRKSQNHKYYKQQNSQDDKIVQDKNKLSFENSDNQDLCLFCEDISVFGLVPYVIYMPNMSKNDIEFIQQNGGEISHLVECFTV